MKHMKTKVLHIQWPRDAFLRMFCVLICPRCAIVNNYAFCMSALAGQTYFSTGGAEEKQDVDLVEQGGVQVATNLYKQKSSLKTCL